MINTRDKIDNTDAIRTQLVNMVNSSGRIAVEDTRPSEVRRQEETAQYQDKENKKQLENELRELSKRLNREITVKGSNSEKVIREIPSKEAIELMKRMREVIGVIFDKQG